MNGAFDRSLNRLLGIEGEFSDDPADSGGKTMWGITEVVARRHGYVGPMSKLPASLAKMIYQTDYWDAQQLTAVSLFSEQIAYELFDTGVNCGISVAGEFLQMALNAFNRQQKDYDDVEVDGSIGSRTLEAFSAFLSVRGGNGEKVLLRALNCLQGARYIELAEAREKDEKFVFGWFLQRVEVKGD